MGFYEQYTQLACCKEAIEQAIEMISATVSTHGTVFTCGNGGSAADAEHIVGEFMKSFELPRPLGQDLVTRLQVLGEEGAFLAENLETPVRAVALTSHLAFSTAMTNDCGAELVFAQQLLGLANKGDTLIGLTTSGDSPNVLYAFRLASILGVKTVLLSGQGGGAAKSLVDCPVLVPAERVADIQELHVPVYHYMCREIERRFFGE